MTYEGYDALHQRIREMHHDRIARTKWFQPLTQDEEYPNVNDAAPVLWVHSNDQYCRCRDCKPPLVEPRRHRWVPYALAALLWALAIVWALNAL
jgi:hypothetical protein